MCQEQVHTLFSTDHKLDKRLHKMNSDLLAKWTAIITNIAVVTGLAFVGLEFRNNTRAFEAERLDSLVLGMSDINSMAIGNQDFAELLYQSYEKPESLSGVSLDRVQHLLMGSYNHFQRVHLAYQSGLLPDEIYEFQRVGTGFAFSSDIGLDLINLMEVGTMGESLWEVVRESAEQARAYCLEPQNRCVARYEAARRNSD
jgi:hypothetical protein